MIFDLLTSTQGHQFDNRANILLVFCSAHCPRQFDMPHDHAQKLLFFTPSAPRRPKSHPWGMTQASEQNTRLICFIASDCQNTHFSIKIFEVGFVIET